MKNIRNRVTSALGRTTTLSQETSVAGLSAVQAQQPIPLPPSSQGPADPLPQERVAETSTTQAQHPSPLLQPTISPLQLSPQMSQLRRMTRAQKQQRNERRNQRRRQYRDTGLQFINERERVYVDNWLHARIESRTNGQVNIRELYDEYTSSERGSADAISFKAFKDVVRDDFDDVQHQTNNHQRKHYKTDFLNIVRRTT
ncbi:hypothetical protein BDC45DRAFT_564075 [Circinella umbellata]|nr:hypothetical protein BDC45DRAFT_564075 [Circinella umbellata]